MKKLFQKIKMFFSKNAQTLPVPVRTMPTEGQIARDKGIAQSLDSANGAVKNWSDIAYGFLLGYADSHKVFMIEELRNASVGFVPEPPSKRAWGGIAVRASKTGIIERIGFQNVKNAKAHCTPATLWKVK